MPLLAYSGPVGWLASPELILEGFARNRLSTGGPVTGHREPARGTTYRLGGNNPSVRSDERARAPAGLMWGAGRLRPNRDGPDTECRGTDRRPRRKNELGRNAPTGGPVPSCALLPTRVPDRGVGSAPPASLRLVVPEVPPIHVESQLGEDPGRRASAGASPR